MQCRCLAWVLTLAVMVAPALLAQVPAKPFNRTVEFQSGGHLTLHTYKGSIELSSWDKNQVEINARIEPPEDVSDDYARRAVAATEVDVWGTPGSLTIQSNYEDVPCRHDHWFCSKALPLIHYTIRAPRKLDLRVDDHKSAIELAGIEGRISVETYKGTVDGRDWAGALRVETYKGKINLAGLRGSLRAETYKGEMRLEADRLDDRSHLETYKGRIALFVPKSQGLSLRAQVARRGNFHSDFDLAVRRFGQPEFEGSINGGGPELSFKTHKGEISLRQR